MKLIHTSVSNLFSTKYGLIEVERWKSENKYTTDIWIEKFDFDDKQRISSFRSNLSNEEAVKLTLAELHHMDEEFVDLNGNSDFEKWYSIVNIYYDMGNCIIQISKADNFICVYVYVDNQDGYRQCISAFEIEGRIKDKDIISEFEDDLDSIIDTYSYYLDGARELRDCFRSLKKANNPYYKCER